MHIAESLSELEAKIQAFPDQERAPKTSLELLDGMNEGAWQAYLAYFLDPNANHGLEERFLSNMLNHLAELGAISFSPSQTALKMSEGIEVQTERQSDDDNRPDIIIRQESEWYLCLELKLGSPEDTRGTPQTVRYANDPGIVSGGTDTYSEGDYIYIKPASAPRSKSPEFTDVDWQQLQPVLQETMATILGQIPSRTLAQLSDLDTAINTQLTMTELDEITKEKKNLYFEYREAIEQAQAAVKPFVEQVLQQRWGDALRNTYCPDNHDSFQWRTRAVGNSYGQIRTPRWEEAKGDPEMLDIHWEHKPKTGLFKKGRFKLLLELEEPERSTMSNSSGERYHRFREDILNRISEALEEVSDPQWEESTISPSNSDKKLARFIYTYQPGDEQGYYECLQYALEDTAPVTQLVTTLLDAESYTDYPI